MTPVPLLGFDCVLLVWSSHLPCLVRTDLSLLKIENIHLLDPDTSLERVLASALASGDLPNLSLSVVSLKDGTVGATIDCCSSSCQQMLFFDGDGCRVCFFGGFSGRLVYFPQSNPFFRLSGPKKVDSHSRIMQFTRLSSLHLSPLSPVMMCVCPRCIYPDAYDLEKSPRYILVPRGTSAR